MSKAGKKAYSIIRSRILSGDFPPKTHLKEEELTTLCDVSRTPIREALRSLAADYYVEIIPNRGTFVTDWSSDDVEDIFNMRMLLEGYAAQQAVVKATPEDIEELTTYCNNIDLLLSQDGPIDVEAFLAENRLFHRKLWQASGSKRLSALLLRLVAQPVVARTVMAYTRQDIRRKNEHHREIIEAIKAKDSAWARSIMSSHILAARHVYTLAFLDDPS
ncbi:MAG: GntR family transcriptional regulator [Alphaproteobacteria bacterium]|nr:MAG: GntR family transcriptional regulator [Alphaproteobacteria bacterium]